MTIRINLVKHDGLLMITNVQRVLGALRTLFVYYAAN